VQHLRLLIYLISFACGISLISSVIHLYPKYPRTYLKKYLKHIIVLNILAILSMFYRYLNLFSDSPTVPFSNIQTYLYSIIFSFGIIVTFLNLFTFLLVLIELLEWGKNRISLILFLMGSVIILLLIIQGLSVVFISDDIDTLMNNLIALDIAANAVILICVLVILIFSNILRNRKKRTLIEGFLVLYGFSFGIMLATALLKKSFYLVFYFSYGISFLILNLLPLIFIRRLLGRVEIQESSDISGREYDHIYANYGITNREKEIIQLIFSGKSNKEIGEILFISVKTVKYHVYNVYRKIKIKNRIELIKLFMNKNNKMS
jgi:DNA-binding CsgD family transcriptional regulator